MAFARFQDQGLSYAIFITTIRYRLPRFRAYDAQTCNWITINEKAFFAEEFLVGKTFLSSLWRWREKTNLRL